MTTEIVDRKLLISELFNELKINSLKKIEMFQVKNRFFLFIINKNLLIEIGEPMFSMLNQLEFDRFKFENIFSEDILNAITILKIINSPGPKSINLIKAPVSEEKRYFINPHSACNLKCAYCFTKMHDVPKYPSSPKKFEDTKKFIDKAMEFIQIDSRGQTKIHIHYSILGEPLLDLDGLMYLHQKTNEIRMKTGVNHWISTLTNGILLSREVVDWMHSNGIFLGISIDGPEEIQNRQRARCNGLPSYNVLAANLKILFSKNWGEFHPGATVTLTSLNTEVDKIFMHLYDIGFRIINFQRVRLPKSNNLAITRLSQKAINDGYTRLVEIFLRDAEFGSIERLKCVICREEPLAIVLYCILNQKLYYFRCPMYFDWYRSINSDGFIYSCSSMTGDIAFRIGHIESSDRQICNTAPIKSVDDRQQCAICWAKYICGGPCLHSSYLEFGEFNKIVEESCDSIKFLIKLGSYLLAELTEKFPESIPLLEDVITKRFS